MKALDLFCCNGVGALGYDASGLFETITGVDIHYMGRNYPFQLVTRDAIGLDYDFLGEYAFIHASPPCQAYSKATGARHKDNHPRLILPTHTMLQAWGGPYVIENVEGSGQELRPNLVLSGLDVGLPMTRRRYFHVKGLKISEDKFKSICAAMFSKVAAAHVSPNGAEYVSKKTLFEAYALNEHSPSKTRRITKYGLEQGIPPRMTQAISSVLFGLW